MTIELGSDEQSVSGVVSDNGVGMPKTVPAKSLGLELVRILAEQLHGSVRFESGGGTSVSVRFPLRERAEG